MSTLISAAPKPKIYHRAKYMSAAGGVSALCHAKPRPIDIKKQSWTIVDEHVTCPKCRKLLAPIKSEVPDAK